MMFKLFHFICQIRLQLYLNFTRDEHSKETKNVLKEKQKEKVLFFV